MQEDIILAESLVVKVSMKFNATATEIWNWLTKPELVSKYFFGTNLECSWELGSAITFSGAWDGVEYTDKGVILEIREPEFVKYSYFSSFSGLEDLPENYSEISYSITEAESGVVLEIKQFDKNMTEEKKEHSEANWAMVLDNLRIMIDESKTK